MKKKIIDQCDFSKNASNIVEVHRKMIDKAVSNTKFIQKISPGAITLFLSAGRRVSRKLMDASINGFVIETHDQLIEFKNVSFY